MKFKIKKGLVEKIINDVSLLVASNNAIYTPIFKSVLFEVFNNEIVITASNTSVSIKTKFTVDGEVVKVDEAGAFLTPIKKLQELIRKTDSTFLFFEITDQNALTVSTNKSRYTLQVYDKTDFPKIDFNTKGVSFDFGKEIIKTVSSKIVFSADNEHKQNRKVFSGININSNGEKIDVVATNMHRLSKTTFDKKEEKINTIIPTNFFKLSNKISIIKKQQPQIWISTEKTQIKTKNTVIQFQNITGTYPDVSKVIPTENNTSIIVDKNELEKALDRIEMFTNDENKINLIIDSEKFLIKANNQQSGISIEKIDKFNKTGADVSMSVSSKYLLEAIKTVENKEVNIGVNLNTKPIMVSDANDEKTKHIILPYRTEV